MICVLSAEAIKAARARKLGLHQASSEAMMRAYWDSELRFDKKEVEVFRYSRKPMIKDMYTAPEAILLQLYEDYKPICGVALVKERVRPHYPAVITALGIGPIDMNGEHFAEGCPYDDVVKTFF